MTTRRHRSDFGWVIAGVILVVVGGFYVLNNTLGFNLNWDAVWPFLLLGLGVVFLARALTTSETVEPTPPTAPRT